MESLPDSESFLCAYQFQPIAITSQNEEFEVKIKQYSSQTAFHGLTLWDSSLVLSKSLEVILASNPSMYHNKRILEIGCGLALPSLALIAMLSSSPFPPAEIVISDSEPIILEAVKASLILNFSPSSTHHSGAAPQFSCDDYFKFTIGDIKVSLLPLNILGEPSSASINSSNRNFDFILFADMIFDSKMHTGLVQNLEKYSNSSTRLFFANEKRDFPMEIDFYRQLGESFRFKNCTMVNEEYSCDDIYVFEAWTKNDRE